MQVLNEEKKMLLDDNENLHMTLQELKDENDELKRAYVKFE